MRLADVNSTGTVKVLTPGTRPLWSQRWRRPIPRDMEQSVEHRWQIGVVVPRRSRISVIVVMPTPTTIAAMETPARRTASPRAARQGRA